MRNNVILVLTPIALMTLAAMSMPAKAKDVDQAKVVNACKRTSGCHFTSNGGGGGTGCSPHVCFECNGKTCFGIGRGTKTPVRGGNLMGLLKNPQGDPSPKRGALEGPVKAGGLKQTDRNNQTIQMQHTGGGNRKH